MVRVELVNTEEVFYHLSSSKGWNHVLHKLQTFVPRLKNLLDADGLYEHDTIVYFDTFLDKTFLWGENHGHHVYKDPWVGVIHHPPDLHNSCFEMLLKDNFRKSLKSCVGLIVLSNYLAKRIHEFVREHGEMMFQKFPEIHVLEHPIPTNQVSEITIRKRILLHMGQHGRNFENFYHVSCPLFNKYFLTNDYFVPIHVCRRRENQISNSKAGKEGFIFWHKGKMETMATR